MPKSGVLPLVLVVLLGSITLAQSVHAARSERENDHHEHRRAAAAGAPFSATVNTDWTRVLEDGATQVRTNTRLIARDGQGRVFQERRWLEAPGGPGEFRLTRTEITDPKARTVALCDPSQRVCRAARSTARSSGA